MKSKNTVTTIALIVLISIFQNASAQTDSCITYLKTANSNFEVRDFDGAIKLLQSALNKCNLDKTDKIQAHKLLALSYLGIDNLEAADKEAETIVKINPNYAPDKFKDDPKYSALFEKFKPVPVFRMGLGGGINHVFTHVVNTYSIYHGEDAANYSSYTDKNGFQVGVNAEHRVFKKFWLELDGQFRQSNYEHTLTEIENSTVNYSEKLSYVDVPLSIKYYILEKKISPYVAAGATFSFMTNALSTTSRDEFSDLVNRIDYRNTFMVGYFGGAGITYKMNSLLLFADVRYTYFPDNVNKEGTRYSDDVNVFKYYYIDDDFTMDNLQINLGVAYNVSYKNKKK